MAIKMTSGQSYLVKVTSVQENLKPVNKKDGTFYKHLIHIEDKQGNKEAAEYLSRNTTVHEFVLNVYMWVKCLWADDRGNTIEPTTPPDERQERQNTTNAGDTSRPSTTGKPYNAKCNSLNISGESITFTMAYAKDLKMAEIARQPEGYKITDKDIEDIATWATIMHDKICNKLTAQ